MSEQHSRQVAESLWRLFDAQDFDAAGDLLHDDFVCEWPQSRERIRGRDNFIALNKNYPGEWRVTVERVVVSGEEVVTQTTLCCGDQVFCAISFFELRAGKVFRLCEYWPEPAEAPDWRAQWVERM
jgi:ketosteroid isomerase-like protein